MYLSEDVTSLGFLHHYPTRIDVVVVCVFQLHSTVIDCRQDDERKLFGEGL